MWRDNEAVISSLIPSPFTLAKGYCSKLQLCYLFAAEVWSLSTMFGRKFRDQMTDWFTNNWLIDWLISQKYDFVNKFLIINTGYLKAIWMLQYLLQFIMRAFFCFVLKKRKHYHSSHKYCKKGTGNKTEKMYFCCIATSQCKLSKLMIHHTKYNKHA